jgi:hypothetical protein
MILVLLAALGALLSAAVVDPRKGWFRAFIVIWFFISIAVVANGIR